MKVYILLLENNKYYVGITNNLPQRLHSHFSGHGGVWTNLYHPIKVVEVVDAPYKEVEKEYTLKYMKEFGWENVRGYAWTSAVLKRPPRLLRLL